MKKHLIAAALILSVVIILSGCYPNAQKTLPNSASSEANGFVGKVSEKIGDAEFNYEIKADFPTELPKIRLKPKKFDEEKLKEIFLRDKTINPNADRPDWVYETTDGSVLCIGGDWIEFFDGSVDDNRNNMFTIAGSYNKFSYASDEQLTSFSSEEAISRANKLLDELGVENYCEPTVITVTPEMGNARLKEYGVLTTNKEQSRDDYDLWTEDDGVYVLKYKQSFNGVDISSGTMKTLSNDRTIEGTDISVYVKKDMILKLAINSCYDVVSLNEETVELKFGADYASNALLERYGKMGELKYPTFFTDCKPEYIPQGYDNGELIFTPAWCFSGYQLRGPLYDVLDDSAEYFYADTGIRYGGV